MRLPDLVAYQAAVQHPSTAFADPQLRGAAVTTGPLGLPRAVAGNFAVTYQLRDGAGQWAVRCFHREAVDRGARYAAISRHLAQLRAGPLVPIDYLDSGVRVGQAWYPITKMAWLEGRPLNRAVEDSLSRPGALADLERRFVDTVADLRRLGIAHGDLQHGNVLVDRSGTLHLVDYDGMFVPALHGRTASESGDPNYQHPQRSVQFDAELDRFAALVIVVALRALAVAPHLWRTYSTGDNLLFRRTDFLQPAASPLFRDLAGLASVRELSQRLASICAEDYARVPTLDEFLRTGVPRALHPRHVTVLNTLYGRRPAARRRTQSWTLRRATVQTASALSPDGGQLATGTRDGRITLRERASGRTLRGVRLPRASGELRALAYTSAGDVLAALANGPRLSIWDAARLEKRFECAVSGRAVRGAALSSNAAWLAASSNDGTLYCWKLPQGRLVATLPRRGAANALAISTDGRAIATAGPRARVWRLPGGQAVADLPVGRGVSCLALSSDGDRLAVGTLGGRVTVWELRGVQPAHEVATPGGPLETLALAADGGAVAATGGDGSVWLRRLAAHTEARMASPARPRSAARMIASSYRLFDWLRRVALL